MAKLTPRARLIAGYAVAMLATVCVVSAVTFVLFQRSVARELRVRVARDVEQVTEVLADRGIGAFHDASGAELLEGEAARVTIEDSDGRVVAGHTTPNRPAVRERVIGAGGRSYVVEAVVQSSAAESQATRRLALILLLSPAVALLLGGAAAVYLADRALRPVEEAYERERRFVADAAHELRTPVTFLRLGVEELRAHPGDIGEEQLTDLSAEVSRLTKLVAELLELSRLERSRPEPRVTTNVGAIAAEVADRFRPLAEAREIELRTDLPAQCVEALASASGVERVLNVLVDNALAHTVGGSVTLSVRVGERVEIDVADTGPGIPDERREEIFEAFFSAGGDRGGGRGSGLGLAIARRTADAMGADLRVSSRVGAGSTFTLSLAAA